LTELGVLILAGGGGERFGMPKAFFEVGGKPMIQLVAERVSKLSSELVISCKSGGERLAQMFPGAKVIPDKSDRRGALTGLISSLPEIGSRYVALVTCDCPKVKPEVLELLFKNAKGHDGAIPRWPNGYIEPLQAVYRTEKLLRAAQEAWESGKMRLADVLKMLPDVIYVSTEELRGIDPRLESFLNVNLPQDAANF
jgi:molybdopterin-guanine dinucleotide biosynthesis protein A